MTETSPKKNPTWTRERLSEEFWRKYGWLGVVVGVVGAVFAGLAFFCFPEWRNAVAGFCALLVIVVGFYEYFFLPAPGTKIFAPNPWLRYSAGVLAILSALLWIFGSIPS